MNVGLGAVEGKNESVNLQLRDIIARRQQRAKERVPVVVACTNRRSQRSAPPTHASQ
jgi:hypothetical protein